MFSVWHWASLVCLAPWLCPLFFLSKGVLTLSRENIDHSAESKKVDWKDRMKRLFVGPGIHIYTNVSSSRKTTHVHEHTTGYSISVEVFISQFSLSIIFAGSKFCLFPRLAGTWKAGFYFISFSEQTHRHAVCCTRNRFCFLSRSQVRTLFQPGHSSVCLPDSKL